MIRLWLLGINYIHSYIYCYSDWRYICAVVTGWTFCTLVCCCWPPVICWANCPGVVGRRCCCPGGDDIARVKTLLLPLLTYSLWRYCYLFPTLLWRWHIASCCIVLLLLGGLTRLGDVPIATLLHCLLANLNVMIVWQVAVTLTLLVVTLFFDAEWSRCDYEPCVDERNWVCRGRTLLL